MKKVRIVLAACVTLAAAVILSSCAATKYETVPSKADARPAIKTLAIVGFNIDSKSLLRGVRGATVDNEAKAFVETLQASGKFKAIAPPADVAESEAYKAQPKGMRRVTSVQPLDKKIHPTDKRDWGALARGLGVDAVLVFSNDYGKPGRGLFGAVNIKFTHIDLRVYNTKGELVYAMKGRQRVSTRSWLSWILGSVPGSAIADMGTKAGKIIADKMIAEW